MCARVCARCNPIFRFNLFTPPPASLRPNLPRVVNTFARIPGPFCPGRARSPLQSPPLRRRTLPSAHDPFVAPSLRGSFTTASSFFFFSSHISPSPLLARSLSLPLSPSLTLSLSFSHPLSLFAVRQPRPPPQPGRHYPRAFVRIRCHRSLNLRRTETAPPVAP
ncbi:unnamed protein product [Aphis gossypii]|uniref:Uncharacterized protein n=1 Tax=Aphis gossypii TaxID=80765 RepID=A0A9P0NQW2_APHGO|nr:unnamed protein product [Aphis gossypii]